MAGIWKTDLIPLNLTPGAARALQAAQLLAESLGAGEAQPVHLLYGLLEEEEGRAAVLLAQAGVTAAAVKVALAKPAQTDEPEVAPGAPSRTQQILDCAREIAA